MELLTSLRHVSGGAAWTSWAGQGRSSFEATPTVEAHGRTEVPAAAALMLLPETGTSDFGRDPRFAELVLDTRLEGPGGKPVAAAPLAGWHGRFARALCLRGVFARFLADELGLATSDDPAAQCGVWLTTPHTMNQLVDTSDLATLSGSGCHEAVDGGGDQLQPAAAAVVPSGPPSWASSADEPFRAVLA